ncbi:uncharacterized protein LOC128209550 [Mya arenaria]|uniref:uncharacterized protein LOC128209550 n=1 Tax=Mya arenaria TaxID=6604 RepID=UPI0022E1E640|nr:uncharacterized protein LOC128209550 [Mya arenaria]
MDPGTEPAMSNSDLLETLASLHWAQSGDSALFEKVASIRLGHELYQRISGNRDMEALRQQTITAITKYITDHPRAKPEELQKEVARQISAFAEKVDRM